MTKGVLYIATGEKYINEAKESAKNTSEVTDLPIALVADQAVHDDVFNKIIIDDDPQYDYIDKPRNLLRTPYEKTLFLDTDAYLLEPVPELFDLLENFDIAAAIDPNEAALQKEDLRYFDDLPESVPEFNTGVLVLRQSEETEAFLESWKARYSKSHIMDQPSFRKALAETEVRFTPLSTLYNCLLDYPMQITGEVKILHDLHGYVDSSNIDRIADRVNQSVGVRVLHSRQEDVAYPLSVYGDAVTKGLWGLNKSFVTILFLIYKFIDNTKKNGLANSIYKSIRMAYRKLNTLWRRPFI